MRFNTNWPNIIGRFIMIICAIILIVAVLMIGTHDAKNQKVIFREIRAIHLLYFIVFFSFYLIILISVSFLKIIKVQIDEIKQELTFFTITKNITISISDLNDYRVTVKRNGYKSFYGLMIDLKNRKKIQLASQNIKDIENLKNFLNRNNISYLGETKAKYPFN